MSEPLIIVEFSPEGIELIERAKSAPVEMFAAIKRGMDFGAQIMLGKIMPERFTGKGPFAVDEGRLGVVTNRLRSSLRWAEAEIEGDTVTGAMGSNLEYFGAHEFGFDGEVNVRAFTRKVSPAQFAPKNFKPGKKGSLGTEQVKAHTRHMHVDARAPLGHGIADHLEDMTDAMVGELRKLWEGGAAA